VYIKKFKEVSVDPGAYVNKANKPVEAIFYCKLLQISVSENSIS